jgi:hypothetical protein
MADARVPPPLSNESDAVHDKRIMCYECVCVSCGTVRSQDRLFQCSRCQQATYCSDDCFRASWKGTRATLALNNSTIPRHKVWCVNEEKVHGRAKKLVEILKGPKNVIVGQLDDKYPEMKLSEAVYKKAAKKYNLHEAMLQEMQEEINGLQPEKIGPVNYMLEVPLSFTQILFNYFLSGMTFDLPIPPRRAFLREGNSCSDERRLLVLLHSDIDKAWPLLLQVIESNIQYYYRHNTVLTSQHFSILTQSQRQTIKQPTRDLMCAMMYALSLESISEFVIANHADATWEVVVRLMEATEQGDQLDPNDSIKQYIYSMAVILWEQGRRLRDDKWTKEHFSLKKLKIKKGSLKFQLFAIGARACGLAILEKKSSIQMPDMQPWSEYCMSHLKEVERVL